MEYQMSKIVVQASSGSETETVNAHMAVRSSSGWALVSANGGMEWRALVARSRSSHGKFTFDDSSESRTG